MPSNLQIFSGGVYSRAQPHAQSLFLFPIVFGINIYIYTTLAKKKNHPRDSRREERCSTCDIMLDQARGKSRGQSRIGLALR